MTQQLEAQNRDVVQRAFTEWAQGGDRFLDILTPDATWTIMGSGPSARTYRGRQTYVNSIVKALFERLAEPTVPHVKHIWADNEHVIVRWEQDTLTCYGDRYYNSYAWFFKMKDSQVVEVTAFLNLLAYEALVSRAVQNDP